MENKPKMTINLPSLFDRNIRLRVLEMVFQGLQISKFSGGTCPQTPLEARAFGKVHRLDTL